MFGPDIGVPGRVDGETTALLSRQKLLGGSQDVITVSVCLGGEGSVRWNLSLFNDMRVDCFIKTEEIVVGKDSCQQLPSGGEDAKVRIGNLEWRIATKWAGDYQVTFRLPEGCTLNHAMARASGCSYHVRIGLSWWQIPILRKTYIIQTFGTSIEEDNFSIREWP